MNRDKIMKRFLEDQPQLTFAQAWIEETALLMADCFKQGHKVLICGNGGSSADSDHMVGELMKGFALKRPLSKEMKDKIGLQGDLTIGEQLQWGLPAIGLTQHASVIFAIQNDIDASLVFAQQVVGYGQEGDLLIGLSTSGFAKNVNQAIRVGKALGLKTIALSGRDGGELAKLADYSFIAPADETYRIQEYHLAVYHVLCLLVEEILFGKEGWFYETSGKC